jgi:hypothetical protein
LIKISGPHNRQKYFTSKSKANDQKNEANSKKYVSSMSPSSSPHQSSSTVQQLFPQMPLATSSSSSPSWLVTVGGTAVVAATAAAWMSYANKRFMPLDWIRRTYISTRSTSSDSKQPTSNASYYLDYNGTTPVYPEVFDAMTPYLKEHFGNPSSSHLFGTEPRKAIETARKQILSRLLGVRATATANNTTSSSSSSSSSLDLSSIWFTGCGTESDNMAIRLAVLSSSSSPNRSTKHIVTCNVEHPAIENYLRHLETSNSSTTTTSTSDQSDAVNVTVTRVPVDHEGRVSAKDMVAAITPDTVLVTLMLANNESGALQPVKEVAEECRRRGILCHTDAAVSRKFKTKMFQTAWIEMLCESDDSHFSSAFFIPHSPLKIRPSIRVAILPVSSCFIFTASGMYSPIVMS